MIKKPNITITMDDNKTLKLVEGGVLFTEQKNDSEGQEVTETDFMSTWQFIGAVTVVVTLIALIIVFFCLPFTALSWLLKRLHICDLTARLVAFGERMKAKHEAEEAAV